MNFLFVAELILKEAKCKPEGYLMGCIASGLTNTYNQGLEDAAKYLENKRNGGTIWQFARDIRQLKEVKEPQLGDTRIRNGQPETYCKFIKAPEEIKDDH